MPLGGSVPGHPERTDTVVRADAVWTPCSSAAHDQRWPLAGRRRDADLEESLAVAAGRWLVQVSLESREHAERVDLWLTPAL